ncbi:MAG: amidase family protein [Rhodanobacteraceae bacterium]
MDPCELTVVDARAALGRRDLSYSEYVDALLARATAWRSLNALAAQHAEALRSAATAIDRSGAARTGRRALEGVPIALKDNIDTVALPTTGGTGALAGHRPPKDAPVAQRLFAAGGLLADKTNMHELAFGITCNNAVIGAVRNPYDPDRIPGGSSGGSAAAVSARMVPAALGTDTGATVRLPAALRGVVGFRPTVGRCPGCGVIPISHTRDTVGPIRRSVADTMLFDSVPAGSGEPAAAPNLRGLRLGLARGCFFSNLGASIAPVIEAAPQKLRAPVRNSSKRKPPTLVHQGRVLLHTFRWRNHHGFQSRFS